MKVKLVVVQGKPNGKEVLLRGAKFLIGRGPECHLRPNSELVSRHHCMFVVEGRSLTLRDLGSTNGTIVNGERVTGTVPIYHEDLIQVGPIGFRIVLDPVPSDVRADLAPVVTAACQAETRFGAVAGNVPCRTESGEGIVEQWLDGDPARASAEPNPDGDLLSTKVETEDRQDTQHELPSYP